MARYKVADGTQVAGVDGKLHAAGEVLEEVPDDAARLLAAGVVVEVELPAKVTAAKSVRIKP